MTEQVFTQQRKTVLAVEGRNNTRQFDLNLTLSEKESYSKDIEKTMLAVKTKTTIRLFERSTRQIPVTVTSRRLGARTLA